MSDFKHALISMSAGAMPQTLLRELITLLQTSKLDLSKMCISILDC